MDFEGIDLMVQVRETSHLSNVQRALDNLNLTFKINDSVLSPDEKRKRSPGLININYSPNGSIGDNSGDVLIMRLITQSGGCNPPRPLISVRGFDRLEKGYKVVYGNNEIEIIKPDTPIRYVIQSDWRTGEDRGS